MPNKYYILSTFGILKNSYYRNTCTRQYFLSHSSSSPDVEETEVTDASSSHQQENERHNRLV